jgi:hypothetical protein
MKKIDLSKYSVTVKVKVQEKDGDKIVENIVDREVPYDVILSIRNILFNQEQRLSALELLENFKLSEKILAAGTSILLEKDDYERLKRSFDAFRGFSENDVQLVNRVLNASDVDVKEDPHPTQIPDKKPN